MHPTNFEWALSALKAGASVSRHGWNGPNQRLDIMEPDEIDASLGHMTQPYIYITTVKGDRVPWLASQGDLFAEDWYEVK